MSELNTPTVTIDDPRVEDIAEYTGMEPTEVLDAAQTYGALQGLTVDQELDLVEQNIDTDELSMDEDEDDGDGPDEDEDGDISGWSEDDTVAEYIPC